MWVSGGDHWDNAITTVRTQPGSRLIITVQYCSRITHEVPLSAALARLRLACTPRFNPVSGTDRRFRWQYNLTLPRVGQVYSHVYVVTSFTPAAPQHGELVSCLWVVGCNRLGLGILSYFLTYSTSPNFGTSGGCNVSGFATYVCQRDDGKRITCGRSTASLGLGERSKKGSSDTYVCIH